MIPAYLTPWIYTHAIVTIIEMVLWLIDQWTGREYFNLKIFIEFVGAYLAWVMVCCVKQTFISAVHASQTKRFSLYQKK